jgi:exo-1,4-beta-D-glucosaminidase
VLDWNASNFYRTPCTQWADFSALNTLSPVKLEVRFDTSTNGNMSITTVGVANPTDTVAFFIRLRVVRSEDGMDVLPVQWDDNYFTLLPTEIIELKAKYRTEDLKGQQATVITEVFNNLI